MNCDQYKDMLPLYVSGDIDESDKSRLQAHLRECESCRLEVAEMREILGVLKDDRAGELTEIEKLRLENQIYREVARRTVERNRPAFGAGSSFTRVIIRVAAVLIIFLIGYGSRMMLSGQPEPDRVTTELATAPGSSIDYSRVMASRLRFSSEGMKVIAKGKEALPPELKQGPQPAPAPLNN